MTTLVRHQVKSFRKDLDDGSVLIAQVRHDDSCGNGHNSFAITAELYDRAQRVPGEASIENAKGKRRYMGACGCLHDEVRKHFPHLAPLIKWHLTATDGPMHYVADTICHVRHDELDRARSCAVWPNATDAELYALLENDAPLRERLPGLLAEFRKDVESLGMTY